MTELELLQADLLRLRDEFDDSFSRLPPARDQSLRSFVVLQCGGARYAVALGEVSMLQGNIRLVRLPQAAACLNGICCVRGEMLAVFDLEMCLGRGASQVGATRRTSSWIIRASGTNAAFAFEQCDGLVSGAIQVTSAGENLVAVEGELMPLLPLNALVAYACAATSNGSQSKEVET